MRIFVSVILTSLLFSGFLRADIEAVFSEPKGGGYSYAFIIGQVKIDVLSNVVTLVSSKVSSQVIDEISMTFSNDHFNLGMNLLSFLNKKIAFDCGDRNRAFEDTSSKNVVKYHTTCKVTTLNIKNN